MTTYQNVILFSWAVFIVVWAVSAFNVKRDTRGGFFSVWRQYWFLRLPAAALIVYEVVRMATGRAHYSGTPLIFTSIGFHPSQTLGWIEAIITVAGVAIAIWARFYLGRNWSPRPAIKEQHELVTSGPYAYVRHPIYTGLILAALGPALEGTIFGICVLVFASLVFIVRINKEERYMTEFFPNDYPAYRARTKRLIPFIW